MSGSGGLRTSLVVAALDEGDRLVVAPQGELDLSNADQLRDALDEAAATGKPVMLDLGRLGFMDAAGLRIVVDAGRRLGERLTIRPGPPAVHRLFVLTELEETLPFESVPPQEADREAAANVGFVRRLWELYIAGGVPALAEVVSADVRWQSFSAQEGLLVGANTLEGFWHGVPAPSASQPAAAVQFAQLGSDVIVRSQLSDPERWEGVIWSLYMFEGRTLVRAVSFATEAEARAAHDRRSGLV